MVLVRGGTFEMGDVMNDNEYANEKPVHTVTLSDFYLATHELTFSEYDAFCTATGREKPDDSGWGRYRRPVTNISWYDAVAYCNWRSRQEGLQEVYTINDEQVSANWNADGYRLPTEAEWEYAARQRGQKVRFGDGRNTADPARINFDGNLDPTSYSKEGIDRQQTVYVGSLNAPNALGLHDMSGNVWEWCWDLYGSYPASTQTNPRGADSGSDRVGRGGSWSYVPAVVRAASRGGGSPGGSSNILGFRLARAVR
jgi:formylglycine-generating enzyme required for sulfatase activity